MANERKSRGHGEGSLRVKGVVDERQKIYRWELRASITGPSGEPQRISTMFTGTESAAKRRLSKIRVDGDRQGVADGKATFAVVLEDWRKNMALNVAEGSRRRYEGAIRRYISGRWEPIKIKAVTSASVGLWYTELREKLGHASIRMIHTVMLGVMNHAVELGLLPSNPLETLKLKVPKQESERKAAGVKSLTPDQAAAFFEAAGLDRGGAPLAWCLLTGVRLGEALALKWSNINFDTGLVSIEATRSGGESGGIYENAPKSRSGRRKIRCQGQALELLRLQRMRREEEGGAKLPRWKESEYVFFNLRGGPYRPDAMKRYIERICKNANLPRINPHLLRHTAASLMLRGGANLAAVSKHLGHSRISITLDFYTHAIEQDMDDLTLSFPATATQL